MICRPVAVFRRLQQAVELPILTKEMRSRMRGNRTPMLIFIATALAIGTGLFILYSALQEVTQSGAEYLSRTGKYLFAGLTLLEAAITGLLAPALTAGAITQERDQRIFEALLLTRLSGAGIVLGKLLSSLGFLLLLLLCAVPVIAVAFLLGGVAPSQVLWSLALIVSTTLMFGSIGLCCSTVFRHTATAAITAYVICLVLMGAWLPLIIVLGETNGFIALTLLDGVLLTLVTAICLQALFRTLFRWGPSRVFLSILAVIITGILLYAAALTLQDEFENFAAASGLAIFISVFPATGLALFFSLCERRILDWQGMLLTWGGGAVVVTVVFYAPFSGSSKPNTGEIVVLAVLTLLVALLAGALATAVVKGLLSLRRIRLHAAVQAFLIMLFPVILFRWYYFDADRVIGLFWHPNLTELTIFAGNTIAALFCCLEIDLGSISLTLPSPGAAETLFLAATILLQAMVAAWALLVAISRTRQIRD